MNFLRLLVAALLFCLALTRGAALAEDPPPNFVLIFTDDQGYQDVGCFGSPKIKTPNLDRMAAEGMRFTDFYVGAPVCSASRASLMTGSYCDRVGVKGVFFPNRRRQGLHPDEITVAEVLKGVGYATACIGKWHLGDEKIFLPTRQGFDSYFGIPYSNDMSIRRGEKKGPPVLRDEDIIEHPAVQATLTKRYTEEALRFIEANQSRPFFLYLPHTMPHVPLFASERFRGTSERGLYGDVIEEIDWSVGKILAQLKKLGVDERTLVVFTSDNGPWLAKGENGGSALPLRDGKFTTFEGGMRVPCIMRWPGRVPAGRTCREIAATIDVLPTFAALAGAEVPGDRVIDGRSIVPLLEGRPGAKSPHEAYFLRLDAVRAGKWKLLLKGRSTVKSQPAGPFPALYDLEKDIGEATNVAAENPRVVERLTTLIEAHRQDIRSHARPVGQAEGDQRERRRARRPARQWTSWRGPRAAGSASPGAYAVKWSATDNLLWKAELPGIGCSTPVVWGQHIFITAPAAGSDALLDFDWSGKKRWQTPIGKDRGGKHRNGSGSNPSPVTDGTYVFAYFRSGNVAGLDFAGKLLWTTNLQKRFGEDTLWWDIGTSPVITEKHVVIAVMHQGGSYLAAFEKSSGDLAWKVDRNYECSLEGDHSYTTPIVIRHGGREAILVWGAEHLTAHDAANGELLWSCAGFNPEQRPNWLAVASAVVSGDVAVVPYGRGTHLAGIRLGGKGDVTGTHRLWTRSGIGSFVPTPAAHGGRVYVVRDKGRDKGEVICIDPETGRTEWTNRLPKHRAEYYASPVIADGKLYATREDGVIVVARVTGDFEVLSENDMGERMIASPVPVAGRLLLRGERHLFCVATP